MPGTARRSHAEIRIPAGRAPTRPGYRKIKREMRSLLSDARFKARRPSPLDSHAAFHAPDIPPLDICNDRCPLADFSLRTENINMHETPRRVDSRYRKPTLPPTRSYADPSTRPTEAHPAPPPPECCCACRSLPSLIARSYSPRKHFGTILDKNHRGVSTKKKKKKLYNNISNSVVENVKKDLFTLQVLTVNIEPSNC
ncbi:hypothetical protein PUN28_004059 [Cardiocondyla obscurior]|uniref:Uncharacterized protein n=1 Tax=Cardiocondyla obscurior TaxID=286306 RepID=A0AAW2GP33_9HYME